MKKLLMLAAAGLIVQATPVIAGNHDHGEGHMKGKGKKIAKMFEKNDSNDDGMISEAEFLDHAKKKFAEKDLNGDGSISMDEAKENKEAKREKWKEKREGMKERMKEKRQERKEGAVSKSVE